VFLHGVLADHELLRDRLVGAAFGHQREYLAFARRELAEGVVRLAAPADELRDDGGVEHGAALADPLDALGELAQVRDAFLAQVPDAVGTPGEQLEGVAGEPGEDHDGTDPAGQLESSKVRPAGRRVTGARASGARCSRGR